MGVNIAETGISPELPVGHECAMVGVSLDLPDGKIHQLVASGLDAINHRGQEAAGEGSGKESLQVVKGLGVRGVAIPNEVISQLPPVSVAFGHTRYSTKGKSSLLNAQPFAFTDFNIGMNGTVHWTEKAGPDEPTSDTYAIGKKMASIAGSIVDRYAAATSELNGAYTLIITNSEGIFVGIDPWGFREYPYGFLNNGMHGSVVASETVALSKMHANHVGWIQRGQFVQLHPDGPEVLWTDSRINEMPYSPCSFEPAYFADAASSSFPEYDGFTNHTTRKELGRQLAKQHLFQGQSVVPVPNSGLSYAEGVSEAIGKPINLAIHPNRYIGRNFIKPQTPDERRIAAFQKFNFIPEQLFGQSIILVDDSVVRASTLQGLVLTLFDLGVVNIELLIGVPPIKAPCYWGVDFARDSELIYAKLQKLFPGTAFEQALSYYLVGENEELSERLAIYFQKIEDYAEIVRPGYAPQEALSNGCFHCVTGNPPFGVIVDREDTKERLEI